MENQKQDDLYVVFPAPGSGQPAAADGEADYFLVRTSKTALYSLNPKTIIAAVTLNKSILLYVRSDWTSSCYYKLQLRDITMQTLASRLVGYPYLQCHKQYLFNLLYFAGIDGDEILLSFKIDKRIYVGRSFKKQVRAALEIFFNQKTFFWLLGKL